MVNKIRLDEEELEKQGDYVETIIKPWIQTLQLVNDLLLKADREVNESRVGRELYFEYRSKARELEELEEKSYLLDGNSINTVYNEIIEEIDVPFTEKIGKMLSGVSTVNINSYSTKTLGIEVQGKVATNSIASGPSTFQATMHIEETVDFMELMKSPLSRKMKKAQYEAALALSGLVDTEIIYEQFLSSMYRSSEFSYETEGEKVVGTLRTGMVIISSLGVLLFTGGAGLGVTIPAWVGKSILISGYTLSALDAYELVTGKKLGSGRELTKQEKEEIVKSLGIELTVSMLAWGILRYQQIKAVNVVGKYTDDQIKQILKELRGNGFKNNPLRIAYEQEVKNLASYGDELIKQGYSLEDVARILYEKRRELGVMYKEVTPQPLRDYIYELNQGRYNDSLGPSFEDMLVNKSYEQIIESSSRPNMNIDGLLSGFEDWLRRQ